MHYVDFLQNIKKQIGDTQMKVVLHEEVMGVSNSYSIDKEGNVTGLNLAGNENFEARFDIGDIKTLLYLNLSGCSIYTIEGLSNSLELTRLKLSNCGWEFSEEFGESNWDSFVPFDTRCINKLEKLEYLNLNDTQFRPNNRNQSNVFNGDLSDILQSTELDELYLSTFFIHDGVNVNERIEFTEIENIKKFKKLRILDLSENYSLDEEDIGFLNELLYLKELNLSNNKIANFSLSFLQKNPNLEVLKLHDNPIDNIPKEIFDRNENVLENVKIYLQSLVKIDNFHVYTDKKIPHYLTQIPLTSDIFLGRKNELESIRYHFVSKNPKILLVSGEGGIGKTTLASNYCFEYERFYTHVAWLFAGEGIVNIFLKLASVLGVFFSLEDGGITRIDKILEGIKCLDAPCLIVLDDANNLSDLEKHISFLKKMSNCHVLITSRITELENIPTYRLQHLSKNIAVQIFKKHYPKHLDTEGGLLDNLLEAIGYNTLVIELFAKNLSTINRFNNQYGLLELVADLQKKGLFAIQNKSVKVVYQSEYLWMETPDRIIAAMYDLSGLSIIERQILSNLAILPSENIPYYVLVDLLKLLDLNSLNAALSRLKQTGWIEYSDTENNFKISPIIQQITYQKNKDNLFNDCYGIISILIDKLDSDVIYEDNYKMSSVFARYAESIVSIFSEPDFNVALLTERLGTYYLEIGNLNKAFLYYE